MWVLNIQATFLIIIGFHFNSCLSMQRSRARNSERELTIQIEALQTDNKHLHEQLELLSERLQKLEHIFEKKSYCEKNSEDIQNLLKQWTAVLKAELHPEANTIEIDKPTDQSYTTAINEPKTFDDHFDCISICENSTRFPKTCGEALAKDQTGDGIYQLYIPNTELKVFSTYCMQDSLGDNAWIIIQRRQMGGVNFMRNWTEYKYGFGDLNGDYWLGLERIHALTKSRKYELWIQLKDQNNMGRYANYDEFAIEGEDQWYKLSVLGEYTGDADNALSYNHESNFSTYDQNHDATDNENCANKRMGGWWFPTTCKESNLNGIFHSTVYGTGINWIGWHSYEYSLKYAHMAIRPVAVDQLKRTQMLFSFKNQTVYVEN